MFNQDSTYCMALFSADTDVFLFMPDGKVKKSSLNLLFEIIKEVVR